MNIFAMGVGATVVAAGVAAFVASRAAADVEQPDYTSLRLDGEFELRLYPDLVVARVDRDGTRGMAVQRAFSPLANYIFANDRGGEKIAMTAPVLQQPADTASWTVSFIMPAGRPLEHFPEAATGSDVRLEELPERMVATYRFSGRWSDARFAAGAERLRAWIEAEGLSVVGDPEYGYYNDPFTPSFMRRNEVLIEVTD